MITAPGPLPPVPHTTTAGLGLAYGVAIALISTLVLISSVLLAAYACLRLRLRLQSDPNHRPSNPSPPSNTPPSSTRAILPGPLLAKTCWPDARPGREARWPSRVVLGESKRLPGHKSVAGGPCPICLGEYRAKEAVRCMPECSHCFHAACIDQWLRMSPTCPVCRSSPAPSTAATPLSDLVPLAFYPR